MVSNAANIPVGINDSDDSGMPELEAPATASAAAAGSPTSTIGGHERMLMGLLQGMQQNEMLLTQLASKGDRDDTKKFSSRDLKKSAQATGALRSEDPRGGACSMAKLVMGTGAILELIRALFLICKL